MDTQRKPTGRPLRPLRADVIATRQYAERARSDGGAADVAERAAPTLRGYVQTWLRRQRQRIKTRSLEAYEGVLERHVIPHFGEATSLGSITRAAVRDFLLGKLADGYSVGSVRHMLGILRSVMNGARFDDNLITQN